MSGLQQSTEEVRPHKTRCASKKDNHYSQSRKRNTRQPQRANQSTCTALRPVQKQAPQIVAQLSKDLLAAQLFFCGCVSNY